MLLWQQLCAQPNLQSLHWLIESIPWGYVAQGERKDLQSVLHSPRVQTHERHLRKPQVYNRWEWRAQHGKIELDLRDFFYRNPVPLQDGQHHSSQRNLAYTRKPVQLLHKSSKQSHSERVQRPNCAFKQQLERRKVTVRWGFQRLLWHLQRASRDLSPVRPHVEHPNERS